MKKILTSIILSLCMILALPVRSAKATECANVDSDGWLIGLEGALISSSTSGCSINNIISNLTPINLGNIPFSRSGFGSNFANDWTNRTSPTIPIYPSFIGGAGPERSISINNNSLSAAVTAIGATVTTLLVDSPSTMGNSTVTFPSTLTLKVVGNGTITVGASETLTLNGPMIDRGPSQIFIKDTAGAIVAGAASGIDWVDPRWFGTNGTDDDQAALQAAIDFAHSGSILFFPPKLWLESGVIATKPLHWLGLGIGNSVITARDGTWTAGEAVIRVGTTGTSSQVNETIAEEFEIDGTNLTGVTHTNVIGFRTINSSNSIYRNFKVIGCTGHLLEHYEGSNQQARDNLYEGLILVAPQSAGAGKCMHFWSGNFNVADAPRLRSSNLRNTLRSCYMSDSGIRNSGAETMQFFGQECVIEHCYFESWEDSIAVTITSGKLNQVHHNTIINHRRLALEIGHAQEGAMYSHNIIIADGTNSDADTYSAIDLNWSTWQTGDGNRFSIHNNYIEADNRLFALGNPGRIFYVSFIGNHFKRTEESRPNAVNFNSIDNINGWLSGEFIDNVFDSSTSTGTTGTILYIFNADNWIISENRFIGNSAITGLKMGTGTTDSIFTDNHFFDLGVGIDLGTSSSPGTNIVVNNNITSCTTPIDNIVTGDFIRGNIGFVTENSGIVLVDDATTSTTTTHGLSYTPLLQEFSLVSSNEATNNWGYSYVNSITSSQFKVNVIADPGSTGATFGWKVQR